MGIAGPFGFSGGLNTDATAFNMPQNQCLTFSNARYIGGAVVPMYSVQQVAGVAEQLRGMTYWESDFATDAQKGIVLVVDAKIYTAPWDGDTDITKTLTDRTGATTVGTDFKTMDATSDILVIAGGSDNARVVLKLTALNANAAVLGGTPPLTDIVKVVNNYTFLALNLDAPQESRVYWSNAGDPETWGASSFLDFRRNDGDKITALGRLGQLLVIFKTNSIGILQTDPLTFGGNALGPLRTFSTSVGCGGQYAVDNLPDGSIVFLGSDGNLYRMDGQTIENLSDRPFPKSSVRAELQPNFFPSVYANPIKVNPSTNEVIIFEGGDFLIYNFRDDLWYFVQGPGTGNTIQFAVAPPTRTGATFPIPYFLFYAAHNATDATDIYYFEYPTALTYRSLDLKISIPLIKEAGIYTPRSAIIPFELGGTNDTMLFQYGYDGGTLVTADTATTDPPNRCVIRLDQTPTTTFGVPQSLQIRISTSGSQDYKVYPIYISDDIEAS